MLYIIHCGLEQYYEAHEYSYALLSNKNKNNYKYLPREWLHPKCLKGSIFLSNNKGFHMYKLKTNFPLAAYYPILK